MNLTPLTRDNARPGTFLSDLGGLPPVRGAQTAPLTAAKPAVKGSLDDAFTWVQGKNPSIAQYLRPQSAFQWWSLPYLASMTPQYIQNLLIGALAGNHVPCWQMFDLMIDTNPEIAACIGEYIDGITEKKLLIAPYCEEDEDPTPRAIENQKIVSAALRNMRPDVANDENAYRQTLRDILFARFHGQSVIGEDWFDRETGKIFTIDVAKVGKVAVPRCTYWVHPVCYAWDVTGRLGLRFPIEQLNQLNQQASKLKPGQLPTDFGFANGMSWTGAANAQRPISVIDFPKNQFLIGLDKYKTGSALAASVLRPLAWWWCVYNFCGDWLLDLAQLFGIPFRKAKYQQGTPENEKNEAREMLQNMGSRGWCLLDERVDVEFEKAMDQGASSPQGFMIMLSERQFRKVILRQTMTGQDSSTGKGFGAGELDVKGQCLHAGGIFACEVLREQFARHILLVNRGDDSELPLISLMDDTQAGTDEANTIAALKGAGAGRAIPLKWINKRFNIPTPGPDDETLESVAPTIAPGAGQPGQPQPGAAGGTQWKCPDCGNVFDPAAEKETAMGSVACPKCQATVTQADEVKPAPEGEGDEYAAEVKPDKKPGVKGVTKENATEDANKDEELEAAIVATMQSSLQQLYAVQSERDQKLAEMLRRLEAAADCKKALESATPAPAAEIANRKSPIVNQSAAALAEMAAPLVKYLSAGLSIEDTAAQRAYFERAIAKWPELTKPIQHDETLKDALTPALVKTFLEGLNRKSVEAATPVEAGDVPGHDFRGNQYVEVAGDQWSGTPKEMHQRADEIMRGFKPVKNPKLGEVEFSSGGRDKTLKAMRRPHEFQSVQAIPQIIERGSVTTEADRKNRAEIRAVHKITHGVKIGDAKYQAEVTVRETNLGKRIAQKFYLHRIAPENEAQK